MSLGGSFEPPLLDQFFIFWDQPKLKAVTGMSRGAPFGAVLFWTYGAELVAGCPT